MRSATDCIATIAALSADGPKLATFEVDDNFTLCRLSVGIRRKGAFVAYSQLPVTRQTVIQDLHRKPQCSPMIVACSIHGPDYGRPVPEPAQPAVIFRRIGFKIVGQSSFACAVPDTFVPDGSIAMPGFGIHGAKSSRVWRPDGQDGLRHTAADMNELVKVKIRRPIVNPCRAFAGWQFDRSKARRLRRRPASTAYAGGKRENCGGGKDTCRQ